MNLYLLGRPCLRSGIRLGLDRKSAALLALLALEGEQGRGRLAAWLWGDGAGARNSLRQLIFKLPKGLLEGNDPLKLSGSVMLDLTRDLGMEGELLGGFEYPDCPEFGDWLNLERERLRLSRLERLTDRVEQLEGNRDWAATLELARRLVALEPLSEGHYRRLMRVFDALGDRAAAVRTFERCRALLRSELNLEPSLETQRLAVLVARGVCLPGVQLHPELPQRLGDVQAEVRTLLESVRVLDSLLQPDTAFETLHAACAVLVEVEATDELQALVGQLEARATTAQMRAKVAQALAWLHFQRGDFLESEASARTGLTLDIDANLRAALENELAAALLRQDRVAEALEWQARSVQNLEPNSSRYALMLSEYALGLANADRYPEAERAYLEAAALLEHFAAVRQRITLLHNLSMTFKHQGRATAALEPLEIAARLLRDVPGLIDDERYGLANRAEVLLQLSRFEEALDCLARAEELSRRHDLPCSFVHYRRTQVYLLLGDASAAETSLEQALESPGIHARGQGLALLLRARIAALHGLDWHRALEVAEVMLERAGLRAYRARAGLMRADWSEASIGLEQAKTVILLARDLGMGGLELSACAVAVRHARATHVDASREFARAQELLETLEPLDLKRNDVIAMLGHDINPDPSRKSLSVTVPKQITLQ